MPVVDMHFEDGVFFAREYGKIEKEDAKVWANAVARYAASSPTPIVAVIDALEVDFITTEARQVFVRASHTPNLMLSAVAAKGRVTYQTARIISVMAEEDHTYIFPSVPEAYAFARRHLADSAGAV